MEQLHLKLFVFFAFMGSFVWGVLFALICIKEGAESVKDWWTGRKERNRYFICYETQKKKGNLFMTIDGELDNPDSINQARDFIKKEANVSEDEGGVLITNWSKLKR